MGEKRFRVSKEFIVFTFLVVSFTILYSSLGFKLKDTNAQPFNQNNLLFEMDTARNVSYITTTSANFYRTNVHPLFVIIVNPIGRLLTWLGFSSTISSILINSFVGAICVGVSFFLFYLLSKNILGSIILSVIFGFSSSQFLLSIVPDTSAFATLSLIFAYIVFMKSIENDHIPKYYWIIAGIATFGITITNFLQTLICFQVSQLGKNRPRKIITSSINFLISIILISIALSFLQKILYPSSALFINLSLFKEEFSYTNMLILSHPLVVIKQLIASFFLTNIAAPTPEILNIHPLYPAITFSNSNYSMVISIVTLIFWLGFVVIGILRFRPHTQKLYFYGLSLCLLFNLFLHSVYGIGERGKIELFLYTGNFTLLVILLCIGWTLFVKKKWVIGIQLIFTFFLAINSFSIFQATRKIFSEPEYITVKNDEMRKLVENVYAYRTELTKFRHDYKYQRNLPNSNFYLFGMGNRQKFLYREGTLINLTTSKIIGQWEIIDDIVAPSEYTVGMITKEGKNIFIIEDNNSIYIKDGTDIITLSDNCEVNLPEFKGYPYSEIMKALHQEVLINILGGKPTPNFLVYPEPWYRDAAMMAMVLEKTQNIWLIEDWIMNLDRIYDIQNGEKESDNLGEVLFLISLVSDQSHPLVPEILHEISLISPSGYITGRTDSGYHPVYQTKWAKFGLDALDIENTLIIPELKDNYSTLTWWYGDRDGNANKVFLHFRQYPYLIWAQSHYFNQKVGIISESDYPLTWEAHASKANYSSFEVISPMLAKEHIAAPHSWHAAEAFLYLMNQY